MIRRTDQQKSSLHNLLILASRFVDSGQDALIGVKERGRQVVQCPFPSPIRSKLAEVI